MVYSYTLPYGISISSYNHSLQIHLSGQSTTTWHPGSCHPTRRRYTRDVAWRRWLGPSPFFFPVKPGENHEKSIENMGFRWIWMDLGRPNFDTTPCVWSSSGMFHIFVRKLGLSREDSPKVGDLPPGWPKSCHQLAKILYVFILVGGLEHGFYFPYIRNNHPNWLIFSEG